MSILTGIISGLFIDPGLIGGVHPSHDLDRISEIDDFWRPSERILQIASARIPLFIGFGASAPIGFLKQGAQLQDPIHRILEAHFTKAQ